MCETEVTIIIPVRNRAALLPRLFRSLERVEHRPLHLILVDNGSTDESLAQCQSFACRAPFPVEVLREPHPGANLARNRGLAACHTEWVYFFDSDDEISPDFLHSLLPLTEGKDLVLFRTRLLEEGRLRTRDFRPSPRVAAHILSGTLNTQGILLRTDFLRRVGGWNEGVSVWQDWELGVRLLLARPRIAWQGRGAFHRLHQHAESITQTSLLAQRLATLRAVAPLLSAPADVRALYLRGCILLGQARTAEPLALGLHVPLGTRLWGCLLRLYTRLGGRGAWRMG